MQGLTEGTSSPRTTKIPIKKSISLRSSLPSTCHKRNQALNLKHPHLNQHNEQNCSLELQSKTTGMPLHLKLDLNTSKDSNPLQTTPMQTPPTNRCRTTTTLHTGTIQPIHQRTAFNSIRTSKTDSKATQSSLTRTQTLSRTGSPRSSSSFQTICSIVQPWTSTDLTTRCLHMMLLLASQAGSGSTPKNRS